MDYAWDESGIPEPGTPSVDFSVQRLSWYPEDYIYMVSYNHPNIINIKEDENLNEWFGEQYKKLLK